MGRLFLYVLVFSFSYAIQAQKAITLENIYSKSGYRTKSVPGFSFLKDGRHYTIVKDGDIKMMDVTTGSLKETIFEGGSTQVNQVFPAISKIIYTAMTNPKYYWSPKKKLFTDIHIRLNAMFLTGNQVVCQKYTLMVRS